MDKVPYYGRVSHIIKLWFTSESSEAFLNDIGFADLDARDQVTHTSHPPPKAELKTYPNDGQ
eukprot:5028509-Amphidinium_carterae.1